MMKKFVLATFLFLLITLNVFAKEEINLISENTPEIHENIVEGVNEDVKNEPNEDNFEPIILEPEEIAPEIKEEKFEEINPYSKEALRGILTKEYDLNAASGMFKDQLTTKFKKGPIKQNTFQLSSILLFDEKLNPKGSDYDFNYNILNLGIKGKFRSEKESYNMLLDFSPQTHENFFHRLVLDAWVQSKRIPHHTVQFGTYRPTVGYEGGASAFLLPFITRSQIARNYGNVRKTGLSVKGDFKYIDYAIEGYSSDTWYTEFFPGVETDLWVNFKPLANLDSDKYGKLKIGGGLQAGGRNSTNYLVSQAAFRYDYKKMWIQGELANADGSNGSTGLSDKKSWGYNLILAYKITKKFELLFRFDDFKSNKEVSKSNQREFVTGFNYYVLGQTLRIALNYVYCQKNNADDSHRIVLGTQILF